MAKTELDFTIRPGRAVWLHGRVFKPGNEAALQEAGFPVKAKREQARRGAIQWTPKTGGAKKDGEA